MDRFACISIQESSQLAQARRAASEMATRAGFDAARVNNVAIVASELATNLLKHAREGELHLRATDLNGVPCVDLVAIDRGPGIANLGEVFADGFSTTGSSGTGLGAIRRLSTEFDIYSTRPKGTALLSRISGGPAPSQVFMRIAAVQLAIRGESVCGDVCASVRDKSGRRSFLVADGLGHGPLAYEAADLARVTMLANSGLAPTEILERIHVALRSTRGAAVAIAQLEEGSQEIAYSGVGNISACIVDDGERRHMVSHNGTAGQAVRKIQEFRYSWTPAATLLMHSDGLTSHWNLKDYPGLESHDPALLAAVLYRDFSRGRDDVTVLAGRAV